MITEKMNIAEIHKHWYRDREAYFAKLQHECLKWERLCKKNPPKAVITRLVELNSKLSRQEYYLLFVKDGKNCTKHLHVFAKVPVGNKFNYYEILVSNFGNDIISYTSHFFDRYQERMKVVGDRKHVLIRYRKSNQMYHLIHKKDKYSVYAMQEGLALAVSTVERTSFVTFIPYDMLKPSQRAAFDKVRCVFGKDQQIVKQQRSNGMDDATIIDMFRTANADVFEDAETLYDLFFQDKVPTDFTESISMDKKEILYIDPRFKEKLKKFKV